MLPSSFGSLAPGKEAPAPASPSVNTRILELWNDGDPSASEQVFREAMAAASGSEARELSTQVARAQGLQGHFDDGLATLDALGEVDGVVQVRAELERGRLLRSSGDPQRARPHFQAAWERAVAMQQDDLAADSSHMIVADDLEEVGECLLALDRPDDALPHLQAALAGLAGLAADP